VEQSLRTELATVTAIQKAIVIVDQATYDQSASRLVDIKTLRKKWSDYWIPKKESANKTWKLLCDAFNEGDKPLETAEKAEKAALLKWDLEQQRIQQELQRKAEQEAREKAEAERAALAVELEDSGMTEEDIAAAVESVQVEAPVVVEPTFTRAAGVSKPRDNWYAEVTSIIDLCKAIGAKKFKLSTEDMAKVKEFFESLLKSQAVANKSTLAIPGVKAVNRPNISGRSR
jgi:hypothetical protein